MAKTIFYSLAGLLRKILFCHSKIKFISSRHHVISSMYCTVLSPKHLWHCLQNKKIAIYSRNIWQSYDTYFFRPLSNVLLFQSNQRFQAIEFVDRHVPEKLDMRFLFYEHEVLSVECVIVKYKATRINTSVTHTYRRVVEVAFSSGRRLNYWYLKYL